MKKRRMKKLNNQGYSLIELIIVIAIIAALTAAAMLTMNIMHSAKAKEAAITVDSEISELVSKSKGKACDKNNDGVINDTDKGYSYGLRLHKSGKRCYIQDVLVRDGVYYHDANYETANNPNEGFGLSLSPYVDVKYTDQSGNVITIGEADDQTVLIYFKKNGTCVSGFGTYDFIRSSNDNQVASVTINKNGSHQSK